MIKHYHIMIISDFCRSCCVGNLQVNVGDFVLINNADDPDRVESAYLAKLLDMFDNGVSVKPPNDCFCFLIVIYDGLIG